MCQSRPLPKQSQCVCPDTLPWLISVSLGIVGDLRRRFAGFELGAHSLDLRCLLFHGCCWALVVSPLCHGYVAKLSKAIKERTARNSESEVNSNRSVSFGQAGPA